MNEAENVINEHIQNFIESQSYIPLVSNFNGGCLYLKNYSTVVQSVGCGGFFDIPEHFMEQEIPILENPTTEEKVILATSNLTFGSSCDYLTAIVKGRTLLETKSKEEAIMFCNEEIERIITERIKSNDANYDVISSKSKLTTLMLSYLDGSLYEKSVRALELFQGISLSNQTEKVESSTVSNDETMSEDENIDENDSEEEDLDEDEVEQDDEDIDDDEVEDDATLEEDESEEELEQGEETTTVVPDASVEATAEKVQNVDDTVQQAVPSLDTNAIKQSLASDSQIVGLPPEASTVVAVPSITPSENAGSVEVADDSASKSVTEGVSSLQNGVVSIPTVSSSSVATEGSVPAPSSVDTTISTDAYNQMVNDVVNGVSPEDGLDVQGATELLNQPEVPVSSVPPVPSVSIPLVEQQVQNVQTVASQGVNPVPAMPTPVSLESMATEVPSFDGSLGGRTM